MSQNAIYYKGKSYTGGGGGSSGGGNLYGTSDPTSDLGNNGDIYMKYGHRYVNTSFISSATTIPWGSTLDVTITDMDTYDSLHIEGTCMIGGYGGQPFDEEWDVNDISDSSSSPSQVIANSDCYMYRDGDTLKFSNTVTSGTITLLEGAKADTPYIVGEYGKIEGEWVGFPEEGYEETTLWEGSQSITQYSVPFTIPDIGMAELNKYDAFAFDFYSSYSTPRLGIMLTSHIKNHQDIDVTLAPDPTDGANPLFMHYDSTNDILKAFATTNHGYTLTKVIGIKYGNGGGGSSKINYSTDEQVVGTWIDGKPLYQKTFEKQATNVSASGSVDITSEIPITCTIKDSTVAFDYNYEGVEYALVNSPNVYYNRGGNSNFIKFAMGNGTLSGKITMTATYIKTTD